MERLELPREKQSGTLPASWENKKKTLGQADIRPISNHPINNNAQALLCILDHEDKLLLAFSRGLWKTNYSEISRVFGWG